MAGPDTGSELQLKANVYLKSDFLTPDQIEAAHIHPVSRPAGHGG